MAERSAFTTLNQDTATVSSKEEIVQQLMSLGIQKGMVLLVQADLQRLGYLIGGEQALIEALIDAVGYEGTLVMPTFTPQLLDPSCQKKTVERVYWDDVRASSFPFDRKLSAPQDALSLQFLRNEGVVRCYHPLYSFAAWGKYAKLICDRHPLHFGLSKDSPLGKIVEFNGYTILLGCEYESCSMFHLARYSGDQLPIRLVSAPIENNKQTIWKDMLDLDYHTKSFSEIGEAMEERSVVKTSYIGNGRCRMFSAREAITLATAYFHIHRD